ncbi:MAG TPA: ABC-three component system middle component 1 [Clostridia bacterium]|nr:ABC-three component system middle component 1 [Clostridia bacterium]
MNHIISNILCELNFSPAEQFVVQKDETHFNLMPFFLKDDSSQVYLIMPLLESQLIEIKFTEILPYIAESFHKTNGYKSDMEKNTSLVFCIKRDVNSEYLEQLQIDIEDDPYYFKKYVFGYFPDEPQKFDQLKKEYEVSSYVEFVQTYILNRDNFQKFKSNALNEKMYRLISDLLIKIPIMPIEFRKSEELRTVASYFEAEEISSKSRMLDEMVTVLNASEGKDIVEISNTLINIMTSTSDPSNTLGGGEL